jgi:hypothetical protein
MSRDLFTHFHGFGALPKSSQGDQLRQLGFDGNCASIAGGVDRQGELLSDCIR